jgi:sphingosine kinase
VVKGQLSLVEMLLHLTRLAGKQMKVDVFSLIQNGKRTISFMSQALGLMADLDIGTEHLRWMGDTRFMVGLIKGGMWFWAPFDQTSAHTFRLNQVIQFKPCPVQLSIKVAEQDKAKMAEALQARCHSDPTSGTTSPSDPQVNYTNDGLPPLTYSLEDADGWTTFPEPILYIYAGKGPYVGR